MMQMFLFLQHPPEIVVRINEMTFEKNTEILEPEAFPQRK